MRVQVNLSEEMVERVDNYSKLMGVSRSALCSMLVGQGIMGLDKANDIISQIGDGLLNAPITLEKKEEH